MSEAAQLAVAMAAMSLSFVVFLAWLGRHG